MYGDPGVDSSMNRPYSGWKVGTEPLVVEERSKSFWRAN